MGWYWMTNDPINNSRRRERGPLPVGKAGGVRQGGGVSAGVGVRHQRFRLYKDPRGQI